MTLTTLEKKHVEGLSKGFIEPANGMEKHYLNVIRGQARAVTIKEKEWVAYWEFLESEVNDEIDDGLIIEEINETPDIDEVVKSKPAMPVDSPSKPNKVLDTVKRQITDIEFRTDLSDDQKVSQITHIACATCAGVAIQPIPFADIFILTPIQAYFGTRIAAIRGVPITESAMREVIREIFGVIGMGVIAQQIAIAAWKFLIPGGGGFVTVPLVYALTYAVMKVIDLYFLYKAKGKRLSNEKMKEAWKVAFKEGKKKQKENKVAIPKDVDVESS